MKTFLRHSALLGFGIALAITLPAFAAETSTTADSTRDHVLFVGSDFNVFQDGELHPVIGAGDRTVVIHLGNKRAELPLRTVKDIRISRGLKLSNLTASLDKIEAVMSSDAVNAEAADQTMTGIALTMMGEMARDKAYGQVLFADVGRAGFDSNSKVFGVATSVAYAEAHQLQAWQSAVTTQQQISSQSSTLSDWTVRNGSAQTNQNEEVEITPELSNNKAGLMMASATPTKTAAGNATAATVGIAAPAAASKASGSVPASVTTVHVRNAGGDRSDRFDLDFTISAPHPLDAAYAVIVTEYTAPKHPGEIYRRVLTTAIGHIDSTPRKVSLYQTAFPAGFTLRTFTVDVYANGQQVATNMSDTKMTMTREEAYDYIVVDYLAAHKGKTLPPAAVLMAPRSELRSVAQLSEARAPVYVSVDENGNVVTISTDLHGVGRPPELVAAALKNFRFIPALEKGLPVAGRAKLVVADFGP